LFKKAIKHRQFVEKENLNSLLESGSFELYPEKIARLLINRGIRSKQELDYGLAGLISPKELMNADKASERIFAAIQQQQAILIVGDFDADGATSSSLMIKALKMLGARNLNFLVPDRFKYGYGLSVKLVEYAALQKPDLIITVDNGIANCQGVDRANHLGIPVIVTDHHLAGDVLPNAEVIVNPNQPGDTFPSKNLAGVGVAFYVMLMLRNLMREKNWFVQNDHPEPNLAELLDLVALGTVADVVSLDKNNRILVEQGLKRIRSGSSCVGINALLEVAKRDPNQCQSTDLGFAVGPRLNAAGRLEDMSIGINCLLAESKSEADKIAKQLDGLNRQRREIEQSMLEQANLSIDEYFSNNEYLLSTDKKESVEQRPISLCLFEPQWHQGVIGILASRVKERINRPVIIFAQDDDGEQVYAKGSARSVPGVHVRDVLALVDTRHPNLIIKFGGHAMAAGLTILASDFSVFANAFHDATEELLKGSKISDEIITDAGLEVEDMTIDFSRQLRNLGPWGQSFPEPIFDDEFIIVTQRVVAEKHLKLLLKRGDEVFDAIYFFYDEALELCENDRVTAVYKLDINEFRGIKSLQLIIEQIFVGPLD
jgi:single-stranded-DNA-specific exonuclease